MRTAWQTAIVAASLWTLGACTDDGSGDTGNSGSNPSSGGSNGFDSQASGSAGSSVSAGDASGATAGDTASGSDAGGDADDDSGADAGADSGGDVDGQIKVTATVVNLGRRGPEPIRRGTALSPSAYKLALVNFWLIDDSGDEVNILNPDPVAPRYDESAPLIADFSSEGGSVALLEAAEIPAGTYTGYKMQFLYIEMDFVAALHWPSDAWVVNDYPDAESIRDREITRTFRLYFNATGPYWKRDFIIEAEPESGEWYWLRRGLEDQDGRRSFMISTSAHEHPPGGAGSLSTIDLFADEEFWGPESEYDDPSSPIIIGTHSMAGGVDAALEGSLIIPDNVEEVGFHNIDLEIDVAYTMLYHEDGMPPMGVTFFPDVLDLGPAADSGIYGDGGLHPIMPRFRATMEIGDSDAKSDADDAYQVPPECVEIAKLEPAECKAEFCPGHPEHPFCEAVGDEG